MLKSMLRRTMLPIAAIAALGGTQLPVQADEVAVISVGDYLPATAPSLVSMPLFLLNDRPEVQEKHGIKVELVEYSNLSALYSDLALGRVGVVNSGPATVATFAAKGAPLTIAGTVARATNAILSNGKPWTAEALKGSRIVAQTSSSSWIVVQAIIERNFNMKAGTDFDVVSSDSTAAAALQVAAGQADYAVVRAEQVILALNKFKNLEMVAGPKALGREEGVADWGYVIAYNSTKQNQADVARFIDALAEMGEWMKAHPDEVDALAVKDGQEPGVAQEFLTSGLLEIDIRPASEAKESLKADFDLLKDVGYLESDVPDTILPQ